MPATPKTVYYVDPDSEPVVIRVLGRATMQNTHLLQQFVDRSMQQGHRRFAFDFEECQGMDSTFLGTMKNLARRLEGADPAGTITVCRLTGKNLNSFRALGLDHLPNLQCALEDCTFPESSPSQSLDGPGPSREVFLDLVRNAHMALADDPAVAREFEDVLLLLKVEDGKE